MANVIRPASCDININAAIFSIINVTIVEFGGMTTQRLTNYAFMPLPATLILFQGHIRITQFRLKVVFLSQVQMLYELST